MKIEGWLCVVVVFLKYGKASTNETFKSKDAPVE